jgi:hypothetical protein
MVRFFNKGSRETKKQDHVLGFTGGGRYESSNSVRKTKSSRPAGFRFPEMTPIPRDRDIFLHTIINKFH